MRGTFRIKRTSKMFFPGKVGDAGGGGKVISKKFSGHIKKISGNITFFLKIK